MFVLAFILAIGDSITYGGSSEPHGSGFVEILQEHHEILNVGCPGSNAAVWRPAAGKTPCFGRGDIDYWDKLIIPTDKAIIMLGTNDAAIGMPTWIYLVSLIQIANGLIDIGTPDVILMTPPPNPKFQDRLDSYVAGIPALCAEIDGLRCGPDVYNLLDLETDFASGNVHPNRYGHAKIASALHGYIVSPEPVTGPLVILGLAWLCIWARARSKRV